MGLSLRPIITATAVALAFVGFGVQGAQAQIVGSTQGQWQNPTGATANSITTTAGNTVLTTGGSGIAALTSNVYTFTNATFNATPGSDFKVGTFTFFNNLAAADATVAAVNAANNADLQLTLNTTSPTVATNTSVYPFTFSTNYIIPNGATPGISEVSLIQNPSLLPTIAIGGTTYKFELTGFANGVNGTIDPLNSFRFTVGTLQTGSADVRGRLTAVPEPGEIAFALTSGTSLLGLMVRARRRGKPGMSLAA